MKRFLIAAVLGTGIAAAAATPPFEWRAAAEGDLLTVTAKIAPEYYCYSESLEFDLAGADGSAPEPAETPRPTEIHDEFFGRSAIYPAGTWQWRFRGTPPFRGSVTYQGCRNASGGEPAACLLPETVTLIGGPAETAPERPPEIAEFTVVRKLEGVAGEAEFLAFLRGDAPAAAERDWTARGFWWVVLLTLIGGVGLNLTPCVLPMIPVNLAIIGAEGGGRAAGFRRGLAYGGGMAAAYGVLGAVVVLTGAKFGALNASAAFNFGIAGIFLVLALAMSGVFRLDFSRWSGGVRASRIRGGKTVAAFVLGATAALLAGACVAPVVVSVLVLAAKLAQEGNPLAAGLPLLLGVGMALPWPLAGAGLGILPKPGRFMLIVKYAFALFILGMAVHYAHLGCTLLPGSFEPEREIAELNAALAESRRTGRPVVVDFRASWCKNCAAMEKNVLSQPKTRAALAPFLFIKFQAENLRDPAVRQLLDRCGVRGLPAFVMLKDSPPST